MLTRPRSRRSDKRIRTTPRGRSNSVARSATDLRELQNRSRRRCSGPSSDMISAARSPPIMLCATDTSATMSMLAPLGLVRPAVSAYGLTNRSRPSARRTRLEFARVTWLHLRANLHWPGAHSEVLAHLLDEQRHLVSDQASICARARQNCQATALAGRGNEEEGRFKLDDRLERIAAAEMLPESPGKALKTGRHGGQVLGILTAKVGGRSDRQTIPGQDHGFVDLGDSPDQVV